MVDETTIRRALTLGPLIAGAGIAWTAVVGGKPDATLLPSLVVLAGLGACIWGTHHFGRLGPDGPADIAPPDEEAVEVPKDPPRKKKRRAKPD